MQQTFHQNKQPNQVGVDMKSYSQKLRKKEIQGKGRIAILVSLTEARLADTSLNQMDLQLHYSGPLIDCNCVVKRHIVFFFHFLKSVLFSFPK